MSRRMGMLLWGLACCVAAAGGCVGKRVDLVEAGKAKLDVVQGQAIYLLGVTVRQGREDVHVSGLVWDDMAAGRLWSGRVVVEVLEPDGHITWRDAVRLPVWRTVRAGPDHRFFHASIPGQLSEGASVRVRYSFGAS